MAPDSRFTNGHDQSQQGSLPVEALVQLSTTHNYMRLQLLWWIKSRSLTQTVVNIHIICRRLKECKPVFTTDCVRYYRRHVPSASSGKCGPVLVIYLIRAKLRESCKEVTCPRDPTLASLSGSTSLVCWHRCSTLCWGSCKFGNWWRCESCRRWTVCELYSIRPSVCHSLSSGLK